MKLLVLSDLHYPATDMELVSRIIRNEEPLDKIIFLGDSVIEDRFVPEFLDIVKSVSTPVKDIVFIRGDDDSKLLPCVRSLQIKIGKDKYFFAHGNQFNIGSDKSTSDFALIPLKINRKLPLLGFALFARARTIRGHRGEHIVLGHTHGQAYFRRLKVACVGCLTSEKNLYNDLGYIVIDSSLANSNLTPKLITESLKEEQAYPL